jgi:hypothetical protein
MQPTGLGVAAMRAVPTVFPDDGFKKLPTNRFIWKLFSKMVDVHTVSSDNEFRGTVSRPCDRSGLSYLGFVYRSVLN